MDEDKSGTIDKREMAQFLKYLKAMDKSSNFHFKDYAKKQGDSSKKQREVIVHDHALNKSVSPTIQSTGKRLVESSVEGSEVYLNSK